jgi:hypothetical protein
MTPEACVLRAVLDLLAAKRILAFRNNVGVMRGSHKGKGWFVKFGTVGMADVVAYPQVDYRVTLNFGGCEFLRLPHPLWIECKAVGRKQTPEQKSFQHIVEANGHSYLVVDDIDKLIKFFKENGI